jgi:hypothetical protein
MGVVHVHLLDIVLQQPPDNLPEFDVRLWHGFALQMAPIHSRAKKSEQLFKFLVFTYVFVNVVLIPIQIFVEVMFLLAFLVGFLLFYIPIIIYYNDTTTGLHKAVIAIVQEFSPKFQGEGYNIVYIPAKTEVVILRIDNSA